MALRQICLLARLVELGLQLQASFKMDTVTMTISSLAKLLGLGSSSPLPLEGSREATDMQVAHLSPPALTTLSQHFQFLLLSGLALVSLMTLKGSGKTNKLLQMANQSWS